MVKKFLKEERSIKKVEKTYFQEKEAKLQPRKLEHPNM